jgi:tryptophan-rich sensory protein
MKTIKYFIVFLIANFSALAVGVVLMQNGPQTEWYQALDKAPWSPASWVFGAAWTSIMVLFSWYMARLCCQFNFLNRKLLVAFTLQWLLNVSWNYIFFNQQLISLGLVSISLLWLLVGYFTFKYRPNLRYNTLFILPYLVWMTIATSLNFYIVLNN